MIILIARILAIGKFRRSWDIFFCLLNNRVQRNFFVEGFKGELICVNMLRVFAMVFNATFNNISVISWRSVLLVEETGVPTGKLYHITLYREQLT